MKSTLLDRSAIHLLHRASQGVADLFAREVRSELTPRQLAVLLAVAGSESCSQTDIVDNTGIDRSTVADMVRRLVSRGLLHRRRSKTDTRAYVIKLTDEGFHLLNVAEPVAKKVDAAVLRALGHRAPMFLNHLSVLAAGPKDPTRP